jgi:RNA polymerase sigma-70 factor (ECF subfamily)
MGMSDNDHLLIADLQACAKGDRAAMRRLFDSEGPRLMGVAMRLVRNPVLAEEAVQDTLLKVWTRAASFQPSRGAARPWLTMILRNTALNILRSERRGDLAPDGDIEALQDHVAADETEVVLRSLDPALRLRTCLEVLDPRRRHAILLAYVHGYSQGEIAGRTGLPLGTLKAWMRRGLEQLRECLG